MAKWVMVMSRPTIVTLSGKAGHGKSSAATILSNNMIKQGCKVAIVHYADYLKFVAQKYMGWNGIKDDYGRSLLQHIGTEVVRSVQPNYWVDHVINTVELMLSNYEFILIPDTRFEGEITRWNERGYKVVTVHISRLDYENSLSEVQRSHISETALDDYIFNHSIVANNLEELERELLGCQIY